MEIESERLGANALDVIRSVVDNVSVSAIVAAVVALVLLWVVWRVLGRRKRKAPLPGPNLAIDVTLLGEQGPPAGPPVLEHYNVPVRLAGVVLAPTGREGALPSSDEIPALIDHAVPGLAEVAATHDPLVRRWPPQLSAEGFARTVFTQVTLPGDGGKGTPWCSVAGRFKVKGATYMAGLILRAAAANNFGQTVIEKEHEWLGVLRVKSG